MKTPNSDNFAEYFAFFGRHFSLEARLPEHVIKSTRDHKFVIGESGDLHGVEIFERLGAIYGDRELNYLMIEPEAEGIFMAETRLLAYSLPFGANFRSNWNVELRGFSQGDECALKIWPWMLASLQCYLGSSEMWCSYHDNHKFEVDVFCVPSNCDVLAVFGKPSWTFEEFSHSVALHGLPISMAELQQMKMYYFDNSDDVELR